MLLFDQLIFSAATVSLNGDNAVVFLTKCGFEGIDHLIVTGEFISEVQKAATSQLLRGKFSQQLLAVIASSKCQRREFFVSICRFALHRIAWRLHN